MTMVDTKQLKEKVVIITGASSGIGASCAREFAREGSFLSITGRNLDALIKVKESCLAFGLEEDKVLVIQADLSKEEDHTKKVVEKTVSHFGKLDILVNSAGIVIFGAMESSSMEDYDTVMNVNVRALFLLSKLSIPYLKETKGNIVNVSSIGGLRSFDGAMSYCISKSAVDQMTRCLSLELAAAGVRVNAVNPGVIKTELHRRAGMDDEAYAEFLEHSKKTHALGRVGEVEEVSRAIIFLGSKQASFITGTTLPIDGGMGVMCPC